MNPRGSGASGSWQITANSTVPSGTPSMRRTGAWLPRSCECWSASRPPGSKSGLLILRSLMFSPTPRDKPTRWSRSSRQAGASDRQRFRGLQRRCEDCRHRRAARRRLVEQIGPPLGGRRSGRCRRRGLGQGRTSRSPSRRLHGQGTIIHLSRVAAGAWPGSGRRPRGGLHLRPVPKARGCEPPDVGHGVRHSRHGSARTAPRTRLKPDQRIPQPIMITSSRRGPRTPSPA